MYGILIISLEIVVPSPFVKGFVSGGHPSGDLACVGAAGLSRGGAHLPHGSDLIFSQVEGPGSGFLFNSLSCNNGKRNLPLLCPFCLLFSKKNNFRRPDPAPALILSLEDGEREGDGEEKNEAENLHELIEHWYHSIINYQIG